MTPNIIYLSGWLTELELTFPNCVEELKVNFN